VQFLTVESFAPHLNSNFALALGEATLDMALTQVSKLPYRPFHGMMREPFSLIFRSSSAVLLPQRSYPLKHEAMGRLDLFIVPIARDAQGIVYQAVFN
jgi:hypothetical protein